MNDTGRNEKKYKFTGETMEFEGRTLRKIMYVRDGLFFKIGQIGGWIEREENLSHTGDSFIADTGIVFGDAQVMEQAIVGSHGIVKDNAQIKGDSMVLYGVVGADTIISGKVTIKGDSNIFFYADVNYGEPNISGESTIFNCKMESTGTIQNSDMNDKELTGFLDIENRWDNPF